MKCSVYIATSIDGYIARPDGDIEWLHLPQYAEAKLNGLTYEEFIGGVDALVMGRHSFEKVLSFGFWPFEGKQVVVLSSSPLAIPPHLAGKVEHRNAPPEVLAAHLESEGRRHLYIDGGVTIQRFLDAGLISEITITRIPVLLGSGIPLFQQGEREHALRLLAATVSDNGFVQERYEVVRS